MSYPLRFDTNMYVLKPTPDFDNDITFGDAVKTLKTDFKQKREAQKAERKRKN